MASDNPARTALHAAGYRCYGVQRGAHKEGSTLWQRHVEGISLHLYEWPPSDRPAHSYEMEAYQHDEREARALTLYSFTAEELAARLPELESRALAAMHTLERDDG